MSAMACPLKELAKPGRLGPSEKDVGLAGVTRPRQQKTAYRSAVDYLGGSVHL